MARIEPVSPDKAQGKSRELLESVKKKLGKAPNLVRVMAHSPATLGGYFQFSEALGTSVLPARVREQIALAVSEANGCEYCLAAHSAMGRRLGLSDAEVTDSQLGQSSDPRVGAILDFARAVVARRGHVEDSEIDALREAGVSDGEITEIVAVVALNTFTNYLHHVTQVEVDFPKAPRIPAPAAAGTG